MQCQSILYSISGLRAKDIVSKHVYSLFMCVWCWLRACGNVWTVYTCVIKLSMLTGMPNQKSVKERKEGQESVFDVVLTTDMVEFLLSFVCVCVCKQRNTNLFTVLTQSVCDPSVRSIWCTWTAKKAGLLENKLRRPVNSDKNERKKTEIAN